MGWASTSESGLSSPAAGSATTVTSRVLLGSPSRAVKAAQQQSQAQQMFRSSSDSGFDEAQKQQGPGTSGSFKIEDDGDAWGPNQGAYKKRPPIMGHPGKLSRMKMQVKTHKKDWETLSLFGGQVGLHSMPKP